MTPALPSAFLDRPLAHRALHGPGRPENALSAIKAAVDARYGIEIDLQVTSDGEALVFHDHELDRMTGHTGLVRDQTAEDMRAMPLVGTSDVAPSLAEALGLIDGRVPVLIELKDQHGALGETDGTLEHATARVLAQYRGPAAVMSFNPHMVGLMKQIAPDVPRGLTTGAFDTANWPGVPDQARSELGKIQHFDAVGASFISHDHKFLGAPAVALLKARAVPVLCWTIRTPHEADKALRVANNITFEGFAA